MMRYTLTIALVSALLAGCAVTQTGQDDAVRASGDEAKLIAVIKSNAPRKEKADACRNLGRIGSKASIAPLAAMLGDEEMSHMARYALEPNPDPAVDQALRDALGAVSGRPLVGVIGSLGVRRDAKAVKPLMEFLRHPNNDVAQAAARALGSIGTLDAAKALDEVLPTVSKANEAAFCEGLFRCAESLADNGKRKQASGFYDSLLAVRGYHQVKTGALRGAILARKKGGMPLMVRALKGSDYGMVQAAARTAQEMPGSFVTKTLATELPNLRPDAQVLVISALGIRKDARAIPALAAASKSRDKSVRLAAVRALPEIGGGAAISALEDASRDSDAEVAEAANLGLDALKR